MINWLKDQYYWFENYNIIKKFFDNIKESKILLFGHPKSGNTWLRFVLYNYRNLLLHPNCIETITYDRLNKLQNNESACNFHFWTICIYIICLRYYF